MTSTYYQAEVESLTSKIEWFSENQKLLDHDCELLRSRESEIVLLKEKITSLQQERQREGSKSRGADAKRIQQLERHIKDLENVIQKRFPNSLSALILSTNAPAGQSQTENR